jgi:hypothetical protein
LPLGNGDILDNRLWNGPHEVDMEQAVIEPCALNLDTLGDHEGALELSGCDPSVQKYPAVGILILAPTDDQLVVFKRNLKVVHRKTRNR